MPRNVIAEFEIEGERFDVTDTLEVNDTIWLNRWDEVAEQFRPIRNVIIPPVSTRSPEDVMRVALSELNTALANYFDTEEDTMPDGLHNQIRWFFQNRVSVVGRTLVLTT